MPQRNSVYELKGMAVNEISATLEEFLQTHDSSACKYCKGIYLNHDCNYIQQLKKYFEDTTDDVKTEIYDTAKTVGNLDEWSFGAVYFLTWLLQCEGLKVDFNSRENMEEYFFTQKVGKMIAEIRCNRSNSDFHLDYGVFANTLLFSPNLKRLSFEQNVLITDRVLELIGKHCSRICEIRGRGKKFKLTSSGCLKLIFKNYKTMEERNPCCQTLEILELEESGDSNRISQFFDNSIMTVIITSFPNLTYLGPQTVIDEMILFTQEPTNIQRAMICNITEEAIQKMAIVLPKLKTLRFDVPQNQDVVKLRLLNTIKLSKLMLSINADSQLYNEILYTEWLSLKSLDIRSNGINVEHKLNLSVLANQLPNLEKLVVQNIRSVAWDGLSFFKSLKTISCSSPKGINDECSWFKSFSKTIQQLKVHFQILFIHKLTVEATRNILTEDYPASEEMEVNSLSYDGDLVRDFINRCPVLFSIGYFESVDQASLKQLNEYIEENNINCEVVTAR